MNYRKLGKTNINISEISLGTWQLGTRWGDPFDPKEARKILDTAFDHGINFIDTADIYIDGLSEKAIGGFLKDHKDEVYVATKCGRGLNSHNAAGYNEKNIRGFVEASLTNMGVEKLDLIQLHCPPTEVYSMPEAFAALDQLKQEGKILNYGVSVERVDEGLKALEHKNLATIQIIFNMFRHKPADALFEQAQQADVGIIARVPLASGLLTGKFNPQSTFGKDDHRSNNRNGEMFDKGETFSGVDYDKGLEAIEVIKGILGTEELAPYALRWILMFDAISTVIPGASRAEQVLSNVQAGSLPAYTAEQMNAVKAVYIQYIKDSVHSMW
ncbi:aryl-alcohol dehydrogenase-like predicted oxidoreductase [Paenibacillus sp. DS2015]